MASDNPFSAQIEGFRKRIQANIDQAGNTAIDMVNELTNLGEAQAKANAQVDSGELRASIHMKPAEIEGGEVEGSWGTNNDHAIFNEYGTGQRGESGIVGNGLEKDPDSSVSYSQDWKGMRAFPFMYPASKLVAEEMPNILEKYAGKFLKGDNK